MSGTLAVPVTADDHALGKADAPVTVVEYGDYQCPACGMAYPFVQQVLAEHGAQMRFVFRNFPLSEAHPLASMAAQVAEGAGALGKFWEMHDWLYENQPVWTSTGAEGIADGAQAVGIEPPALEQALEDERIAARVRHDFMGGVRSGVNGTPSFFINGRLHAGGFDTLGAAVARAAGSG
ncbi:MAG: protein-disulfide isomerase [Xanthomonadaceae bacterium]|nr:protein-disulfide isomerase [Xanthomonadaceae bacterium]